MSIALGALPLASLARAEAKLRAFVTCRLEDAIRPDQRSGTDQTAEFRKLFLWLRSESVAGRPRRLIAGTGRWQISGDFAIDWDGFWFEGAGDRSVIVQTRPARGLFRVFGNEAVLKGFRREFVGDMRPISERYYGYSAAHRAAAVMLHGSRCTIEDVSVSTSHTAICLRGPVKSFGGARTAPSSPPKNFDWSAQAVGNRVRRVRADHCQLAISGNQQQDLRIEGLVTRDTIQVQIPPHALYLEPGGPEERRGSCHKVAISGIDDAGNPYGNSVKLEGITDLDLTIARLQATAGVLTMNLVRDGRVRIGATGALGDGAPQNTSIYGAQINACERVLIEAGELRGANDVRLNGVAIGKASSGVTVRGMRVAPGRSKGLTPFYPFQVRDRSSARFIACGARTGATDRATYFCDGSSEMHIDHPIRLGGAALIKADTGAAVTGTYSRSEYPNRPQMGGGADFSGVVASRKAGSSRH